MDFDTFKQSLSDSARPTGVSPELQALWEAGRGGWNAAHNIVQNIESPAAAWVHAYLHRQEGDLGNAAYWYSRARRPICKEPLEREWEQIARELLG